MTVASAIKKVATKLEPTSKTDQKPTGIQIPSNGNGHVQGGPKTPKTPQDEAIAFFSGEGDGDVVDVYELWLEHDGSPGQGKDVSISHAACGRHGPRYYGHRDRAGGREMRAEPSRITGPPHVPHPPLAA